MRIKKPSKYILDTIRRCLELRNDGRLYWKAIPPGHKTKVGDIADWVSGLSGYTSIRIYDQHGKEKKLSGHQIAWFLHWGTWPHQTIDHKDRKRLSYNHPSNLRLATSSQQRQNSDKPSNNTSGHKGVYWSKASQKWYVQIQVEYRRYCGGLYETLLEAVGARKALERLFFGEWGTV